MHNLPYSLIRDLFAFRFQIQDTDSLPVVRQKLEQGVAAAMGAGEESQMRAHFIGHLLGFELGESSHLAGVLDDAITLHVHFSQLILGMHVTLFCCFAKPFCTFHIVLLNAAPLEIG